MTPSWHGKFLAMGSYWWDILKFYTSEKFKILISNLLYFRSYEVNCCCCYCSHTPDPASLGPLFLIHLQLWHIQCERQMNNMRQRCDGKVLRLCNQQHFTFCLTCSGGGSPAFHRFLRVKSLSTLKDFHFEWTLWPAHFCSIYCLENEPFW